MHARQHRLLIGALRGGGVDESQIEHAAQHIGAAPGGALVGLTIGL